MKNWIIIISSIIVTPIAIAVGVLLSAGGDGTYVPMKVLFPFWVLTRVISQDAELKSVLHYLVLLIQYPIYGVILVANNNRGKLKRTGYILIMVHLGAIFGAFILAMAYNL